ERRDDGAHQSRRGRKQRKAILRVTGRVALSDHPPRSSHYIRFVAQTVLVAAAFDSWRLARIERRHRVFGMLKIRHQVVRCAARESLDARILYDRSDELNDHRINQ